jgi:hypothetical protein
MFISGCSDDETEGVVDISIKLQYEGEPLVMLERHDYPNGYELFISRFSFFASNIQLQMGTTALEVNDVEYWNFVDSHSDVASAQNGMKLSYDKIPEGNYSGISFGIGVPASLNSQTPADFDSANPLSNVAEYWADWNSYIFMKTEGKMDPDGNGVFENEDGFALHLGSNDAFRSVAINKTFTVSAGNSTELEIIIDLKDMFDMGGSFYDLVARPQIHTLEALPNALPLMDNLAGKAIR